MVQKYHIVAVNKKSGRRVLMTGYPMDHHRCCVMLTKLTKRKETRYMLVMKTPQVTPDIKVTGKAPVKAQMENMRFFDVLRFDDAEYLWSGCIDAPRVMASGYVHKNQRVPYTGTCERERG